MIWGGRLLGRPILADNGSRRRPDSSSGGHRALRAIHSGAVLRRPAVRSPQTTSVWDCSSRERLRRRMGATWMYGLWVARLSSGFAYRATSGTHFPDLPPSTKHHGSRLEIFPELPRHVAKLEAI